MTQIKPIAPVPQEDLQTVVQSRTREWHFHIYFLLQSPTEKAAALALRDAVLKLRRDGAFVAVPLHRVNEYPIGPHPAGPDVARLSRGRSARQQPLLSRLSAIPCSSLVIAVRHPAFPSQRILFIPLNMPTPESEMFKAQKPSVAPTFNGVDFDDTKAYKAAEDAVIREQWVGAMMTRLVGEELSKCYIKNGNNHLEKCGDLREKYLELLAANKIKGTRFLQQNYLEKKDEDMDIAAKVHTSDKIAKLNQGRFSS